MTQEKPYRNVVVRINHASLGDSVFEWNIEKSSMFHRYQGKVRTENYDDNAIFSRHLGNCLEILGVPRLNRGLLLKKALAGERSDEHYRHGTVHTNTVRPFSLEELKSAKTYSYPSEATMYSKKFSNTKHKV